MVIAGGHLAAALLALAISVSLASSVDARHRKYRYYDFRYSRQYHDTGQFRQVRQYQDEYLLLRENERRGRGAFAGIVVELIHSCSRESAELDRLPFDAIVQTAHPDDAQRAALDELRKVAATTVTQLASECPQGISAHLPGRLDNAVQGIDSVIAALDAVRPPLQNFHVALNDEQKARLLVRGRPTVEAPTQVQKRSSRRERRRGEARRGSAPAQHPLSAVCEQLAASLRDWPIRGLERDMQLTDPQRIALYELAIASLKAANTLACPAEGALTPVGRLDTMRLRLSAMRGAVIAVRPALLHFYEALDEGQKQRFAQM